MNRIALTPSSKELQIAANHSHIKWEEHQPVDYHDSLCVKPWGHEFLVYQSKRIGIWYLTVQSGQSTSLHCHFNKDTQIIVLRGAAWIRLIDDREIALGCMDTIHIPKYCFHALSSFSPETVLLEIEIYNDLVQYSDKNDLLRIQDVYKRENTGYAGSVEVIRDPIRLRDFGYFCLEQGMNREIQGVGFSVHNGNTKCVDTDTTIQVLLDGSVYRDGEYFAPGSLLKHSLGLQSTPDSHPLLEPALILSLTRPNYREDNKIIYSLDHLACVMRGLRDQRIVLSSGCYDIVHVGHLNTLREAKRLGDQLMICLSSDRQIRLLKGADRPVNCFQDRLDLFKTISYVDWIVVYDEEDIEREATLGRIMKCVDPYTWVKGSDYTREAILTKHPYLKRIDILRNIEDRSTTRIIQRIRM